eukprot:9639459-Ditylum_brightwellii.AAC.1
MRHLNVASIMTAASYSVNMRTSNVGKLGLLPSVVIRIHENSVDIVQRIIDLASVVTIAGSNSVDILALLMEHRFVRSLFDNSLMRAACQHWYTLSNVEKKATNDEGNMAGHPSSQLRGYFPQSSDEQRMGTDSS